MNKSLFTISVIAVWLFSAGPTQAETIYFLVAEIEPLHNDSYVLGLSEYSDIYHARQIIINPETISDQIVVARIVRSNPEGLNRNYFAEGLPVWSWQVDEFLGFAENTAEILDGWPTWVENDSNTWPSGANIGFWQYTVVQEMGTEADLEAWNCDLSPNGFIDLKDFGVFAEDWLEAMHWGADIDGSYNVDFADLAIMASYWLEELGPDWY